MGSCWAHSFKPIWVWLSATFNACLTKQLREMRAGGLYGRDVCSEHQKGVGHGHDRTLGSTLTHSHLTAAADTVIMNTVLNPKRTVGCIGGKTELP